MQFTSHHCHPHIDGPLDKIVRTHVDLYGLEVLERIHEAGDVVVAIKDARGKDSGLYKDWSEN